MYTKKLLKWLKIDNYNLVKLLILASTILKPNIKSPLKYNNTVADLANRGINTVRRTHTAYTIGLSINEDLKLKKRKGKDKQQRKKLYTIC